MRKYRITYELIETIVAEVEAESRLQAIDSIKMGDVISEFTVSDDLSDEKSWDIEEIDLDNDSFMDEEED